MVRAKLLDLLQAHLAMLLQVQVEPVLVIEAPKT